MFARLCTTATDDRPHSRYIRPWCSPVSICYAYDDKEITYQPRLRGNKIINQSLTPYYQISEYISSFIEKLFRTTPKQRAKRRENAINKRGCSPFLLIKGTCAQTQYKIPYFYQPFDLSNIEFSPSRRARPCPEFQASI
jgi:hypothetical protein